MIRIDLTAAIEATARELAGLEEGEAWPSNADTAGGPAGDRDGEHYVAMRCQARDILIAALPHIREALAQQVEELSDVHPPGYFATRPSGLIRRERAARIVRGDRS